MHAVLPLRVCLMLCSIFAKYLCSIVSLLVHEKVRLAVTKVTMLLTFLLEKEIETSNLTGLVKNVCTAFFR